MKSWNRPQVPRLSSLAPAPRVFDTSTRQLISAETAGSATIYVCGITPYDATHLGHAFTYLAFDTLIRCWLDSGYTVTFVQNTTDIDDPLLERASATGIDWRVLASTQTDLFRSDMELLSIIPPDHYVPVTAVIPEVAAAVDSLLAIGLAYEVPAPDSIDEQPDLYFDSVAAAESTIWHLGLESNLDRPTMLELSAQRGGDPERFGKRDALDPLLWRAARSNEPAWDTVLGLGRPGWHIECSVIAVNRLGTSITVQGGGSDLLFPHHEFSAAHASALSGEPFAKIFAHAGMVAYQGEKMSKSLGNLVLVSRLVANGADPRAIRLALLANHYRSNWEWTDDALPKATARLERWLGASMSAGSAGDEVGRGHPLLGQLREALANDLNTPAAIALVDDAVGSALASGGSLTAADSKAVWALLGIDLTRP
ncbi:MAG: cysteine--1-D-myo-inosityl 2-amino-2-deoxy-alpha-D-glucopyranoside ligase [Microbacteriaceae bacterium]|nr:cysteine--1-D-myo-inosityl 2-amino-2-deoxy-alpha-D-glucopyranoside ligase [Microbacteriaceae bacterium]